jgi:hypothetical protein
MDETYTLHKIETPWLLSQTVIEIKADCVKYAFLYKLPAIMVFLPPFSSILGLQPVENTIILLKKSDCGTKLHYSAYIVSISIFCAFFSFKPLDLKPSIQTSFQTSIQDQENGIKIQRIPAGGE